MLRTVMQRQEERHRGGGAPGQAQTDRTYGQGRGGATPPRPKGSTPGVRKPAFRAGAGAPSAARAASPKPEVTRSIRNQPEIQPCGPFTRMPGHPPSLDLRTVTRAAGSTGAGRPRTLHGARAKHHLDSSVDRGALRRHGRKRRSREARRHRGTGAALQQAAGLAACPWRRARSPEGPANVGSLHGLGGVAQGRLTPQRRPRRHPSGIRAGAPRACQPRSPRACGRLGRFITY